MRPKQHMWIQKQLSISLWVSAFFKLFSVVISFIHTKIRAIKILYWSILSWNIPQDGTPVNLSVNTIHLHLHMLVWEGFPRETLYSRSKKKEKVRNIAQFKFAKLHRTKDAWNNALQTHETKEDLFAHNAQHHAWRKSNTAHQHKLITPNVSTVMEGWRLGTWQSLSQPWTPLVYKGL